MAPFYGWGSTASRLEAVEPLPEIPGAYLINLGRMNG